MFYANLGYNLSVASLVALMLIPAAFIDLRSGRIPNRITYPAILIFALLHFWLGGLNGLWASLLGLASGLTATLIPYALGRYLGAGDVKLMAAVGAGLGVSGLLNAFVWTCLAGGVQALGHIFRHQDLCAVLGVASFSGPLRSAGKSRMRYGLSIALGTLVSMLLELSGIRII